MGHMFERISAADAFWHPPNSEEILKRQLAAHLYKYHDVEHNIRLSSSFLLFLMLVFAKLQNCR